MAGKGGTGQIPRQTRPEQLVLLYPRTPPPQSLEKGLQVS